MEKFCGRFMEALLHIDRIKAKEILAEFRSTGKSIYDFFDEVVAPALEIIGEGWEEGSITLSQVYMSGKICEELTDLLLADYETQVPNQAKIAIATLIDHHALGKRIILSFLRARGYKILDYGYGLGVDELVDLVLKDRLDILLISTLMLPSALKIKPLIEKLRAKGTDVMVIVGGAPFVLDEQLWQEVDAYAMGKNPYDALELIEGMSVNRC
ncbi:cobalamin B12-binding domain-containing protein [Dethiobacter alkaliphilus]|uniref:Cobalamin B12-binding domain protein n=1 Tax=Dethiobacter alkaliphilus AHT 1 TaxID=555088 RepID=C0GFF3_DETAL|nr:cobalamin-dependent protein [Dethiobacter alkaliphilus]EEG77913.1 cobalamin B12-binding domain protein [Dethiobacter alkaliphilus AHT 1]